ncbi:MAG TPA: RNA-protein complex protein Nop10 [Thermoplasmataceae archaeon]|nr:RNA-protein complex protein Nop10 [Thermoplasmataceae archaeon]
MRSIIRKCIVCGKYTLRNECPSCGGESMYAIPPKYSEKDRFQKYRLEMLRDDLDGKNNTEPD